MHRPRSTRRASVARAAIASQTAATTDRLGGLDGLVRANIRQAGGGRCREQPVAHSEPRPLAATERRISLVPPRTVNEGALRIASNSSRSNARIARPQGSARSAPGSRSRGPARNGSPSPSPARTGRRALRRRRSCGQPTATAAATPTSAPSPGPARTALVRRSGAGGETELLQQQICRQPPLGTAALVGELRGVLRPAAADLPSTSSSGTNTSSSATSLKSGDRRGTGSADRKPVGAQIDDQLAEARVPIFLIARAAQDDEPVALVGAARSTPWCR